VPGCLTQAADVISPEDSDAILRVCAYHRKDFDLAVIWFLRTHTTILTSILTSSISSTPTATLGKLDRLPLELINTICLELDIASLLHFRQTNLRARQVISSVHEYRTLIKHAISPLCAALRTGTASRITLSGFYHLLCTQSCSLCGNKYGDLVHLPLWIRCCSSCLRESSLKSRVATLSAVKRILKLSGESIAKLPKLTMLAGTYTMNERLRSSRVTIVSAYLRCQLIAKSILEPSCLKRRSSNSICNQFLTLWLAVRCQASIVRPVKPRMEYPVLAAKLR
jgi:hypothetical protein